MAMSSSSASTTTGEQQQPQQQGSSSSSSEALLLLDRFLSSRAGTSDVHASLQGLIKCLRNGTLLPETLIAESDGNAVWKGMLKLLQEQQNSGEDDEDDGEEGDVHEACTLVVLEMNRYLLQQASSSSKKSSNNDMILQAFLTLPDKGQWLEAWVDLACSSTTSSSVYIRVLGLQCLQLLLNAAPQVAQQQLLSAPNALHRLGDLLSSGDNGGGQQVVVVVEEQVRNEALLLAATVTQQSSAASKIWIFGELPLSILQLCVTPPWQGLTSGNVLVLDCLQILINMLSHDATASQLVWQSTNVMTGLTFAQGLAQLLDLRQGIEFMRPGSVSSRPAASTASAAATMSALPSRSTGSNDDDDDLDDLLASGNNSTSKNARSLGASSSNQQQEQQEQTAAVAAAADAYVPHLTAPEEAIIKAVLDLIQMLLQQQETLANTANSKNSSSSSNNNKNALETFWKREHFLVRIIWDLALVAPPPPAASAPCAMPSCQLQRHALHVVASVLDDVTTCTRLAGMDRLLYLSCTGMGGGMSSNSTISTLQDRWSMSLAAVHVLRQTFLSTAQDYLLHALAPPPDDADTTNHPEHADPDYQFEMQQLAQRGQVIPRLLYTVQGYLRQVVEEASITGSSNNAISENVRVGLMGSLLALGVFIQENEASRTMLLKLTRTLQQQQQVQLQQAPFDDGSQPAPLSLMDDLFQALSSLSSLQNNTDDGDGDATQETVGICILRFLGEWMDGAPMVVQAFLSHAHSSSVLPAMLLSSSSSSSPSPSNTSSRNSRRGLTALVLGLAMTYMENERKCGGWTRDTLLDLLLIRNKNNVTAMTTTATPSSHANASGLTTLTLLLDTLMQDKNNSKTGGGRDDGLPWWRDDMEATIWSDWYHHAVWTVRKCVVRELTLSSSASVSSSSSPSSVVGSGQDAGQDKENVSSAASGDESSGAGAGGGDATSPENDDNDAPVDVGRYRALQSLVAQQSNELDQVRQALVKAEKQNAAQEKQLSMWQKRVESTPTELDRILTESSTRNTELEQTIADMEEKLTMSETKWHEEIKTRDETVASLQKELHESKAREDECREERDSLREDVTGLSAAYSSLEEEYRRCQQEAASSTTAFDATTTSTPPGEGREETDIRAAPMHQQQPEGEASEQISSATASNTSAVTTGAAGSTEVATLRAENNRLRNDARAAEEWMALAVERLGDMNTQNMTLQQQIQAVEEEMEELRSSDTQYDDAADQRLAEERDRRAHAEQEIAELSAELHASLQEERGRRAEVEVMAAQAREAAERSLAEEQGRRAQVEAALAQAHDQMQSIYDQMSTERDDARAQVARLEEQLAQASASAEPSMQVEAEILALRNTIDSLTEQVAAAQADVERTRQSEQEEIYRRESQIRELESKLGDGLGSYTVEDINSRDEELQQLRESNEAAQEWMSKAVEHHNMLSHQLADLSNENKSLKSKVKELTAKALTTSSASKLIEELQRDLEERTDELSSANSQLSAKEQAMQELLNAHASESKIISQQLSQSQAEVEMLRAGLKAEEARIHELAEHSEGAGLLEEELRAKVDELEKAVRMKEYEIEEATVRVAAMDMEVAELKADLALETEEKEDFIRQVETLQKTLQVEGEKLVKDDESAASHRQQIEVLESALAAARGGLEADEKVVHQWEERVNELEALVKNLEDQLESQKQEASDAIAQWESRCEHLQSNAAETSESDHDQADRIVELEALLKHRDEQLEQADEDSRKVVSQWEEGYIRLEKELEVAQEQLFEAEKAKEEVMLAKEGDAIAQVLQVEDELKAQSSSNQAELHAHHQAEIDRLTVALIELRVELDAANETRLKLEEEHEAALNQLELSEREADDAVSEWEQSFNDIQQQFNDLQEEFRVVTEEKESALMREQEKLLEIEDLQQRLREQKETATGEFCSVQERLENDIATRDFSIGELQSQLTERAERLLELEKELGERESAAADAIASVTSYESDVEGLTQRIEAVSKERDALQEQLAQVELDANNVVQQWKERTEATEEQLVLLQNELTTANDEKETALAREREQYLRAEDLSQQLETLTVDHGTLNQRLKQVERDANDVVQQWKDRSDLIEQQLKQLENDLLVSNADKESALVREQETSIRVADLEGRIDTLQSNASQEHSVKCQQYEETIDKLGRTNDELKVQVEERDSKILELEQTLAEARATADENLNNVNAQSMRVDELEQQVAGLQQEKVALGAQMEEAGREADDVIFQWQESYNCLQEEVTQAQNELRLALEAKDDVAVHEHEKSIRAADLEEQLHIQQEHAAKELSSEREKHDAALTARDFTINELQSQLNENSDKLTALEQTVDEVRVALRESTENSAALQLDSDRLQEQIQRLTTEKEMLENQIDESGRDDDDVIFQWEESYNALQEELTRAKNELRLAAEAKEDVTVHDREKSVQVAQLEEMLHREQMKAAAELSAEREKFDAAVADHDLTIGELQSQLRDYSDQLSSRERAMEDSRADLEKSLEKVAALEREAESLQQQIETLTAEKDELDALLETEQRDAEDVIAQWESSYTAVQSQLEQAQDELRVAFEDNEELGSRVTEMQSQIADLNEQLARAQNELQQSLEDKGGVSMREQQIAKELESLETQLAAAKEELSVLEKEKEEYLKREDEQLAQIEELRDETRLQQTASEEVLADLEQRAVAVTERDNTITELQSQLTDLGTEISRLRLAAEEQQSKHAVLVDELEKRAAFGEMEAENLSQERDSLVKERSALQEQLHEATANVESSVSGWEADCNEAKEQFRLVREELAVATSEKDEAEARAEQLVTQIEDLKEYLSVQEMSAAEAILAERRDHEEAIASLNLSLDELRAKVAEQAEEHSALERASKEHQEEERSVANDLRKTADAQKVEIESLQQRIKGLVQERDAIIKQTEAHPSMTEEETQEHSSGENLLQVQINTLRTENDDLNVKVVRLEENLHAESQRRSAIEEERGVAQRELENVRIESEETINLWTERVEELDAMIQNLQTNLEATQTAAEEAIGVWESRCQELQVKLESSAVSPPEIETEKSARKAAEERLSSLQKKLEETEEKFSSFRESALSEQARAHSSGDAQRLLERERVEGLEREFEEIRGSRAVLEEERDRLQLLVSELEHELGQTNDALQFHITNEVSEQATRIAAEALRHQIDEMRAQADMDHSDFRAEQIARLAAEKEVTRLRGDLAALLGMEDNEENLSEIQRRTIDATEHFQRKERAEIEELKNALSRAVDELEDSRAAIHEYEERAGKADLQTSMVEQELVTAKTDLLFLSRTIEEMRDAESSRRVALENRIASLEMDHEVLRKFHAAEVENIRNEINQVTMEKDQLAQCLRESEKNRDALVQASSRGQTQDGEVSLEMEVRLLRMERAQLLEAAAEEASRGERRLREARAAEKSSKEADVFVEKELRLAAEMALKNAEKELEVLRAEVGRATANRARSNSTALGELTNTIDELRGRVHLLADENSELRTQLQEIKSEAASTIAQLTDECRHARSRTSQLEREGRYEAEVRAEVARLQASDASKENPAFFGGDDDAARQLSHYNGHQHHHPGATAEQIARLYDVVEEQKQTMMEERLVHAEINKDFEDCLAILAQRALELQSLREALTQAAGEEAVDAAIRVAEERSVEQHGSFVRENE